jgi:hypothetical protein
MGRNVRKTQHGPAEVLTVEAEEFPTAVIVELWHQSPNGKREFLDSRRYDTRDDGSEVSAVEASGAASPGR